MKTVSFTKYKLQAIYRSGLTYGVFLLEISFLIVYAYVNNISSASEYAFVLKKDLLFWIMFLPGLVIQHKTTIFTTYYNVMSRVQSKKRLIVVNYTTIAISTFVSAVCVICVPLLFVCILGKFRVSEELFASIIFFILRYAVLAIFMQYIIYTLLFLIPALQKKNGGVSFLPFILYLIFSMPMEILAANGQYVSFLDFSAGKNYVFIAENEVLWGASLLYNFHLIIYLVLYVLLSVSYMSRKGEFLENASSITY